MQMLTVTDIKEYKSNAMNVADHKNVLSNI